MSERRPALGKGLSALIPDAPAQPRQGAIEVDIDLIAPSDQQPRLQIDDGKLAELAASVKANGVIQPILVRRTGSTYRIIAGERRWRASQRAGLLTVPVVIRDVPEGRERQLLELALVENLQREDLNPVDEAIAYQRLTDEFGLTQEQIAAAVGKDRTSVANYLRLLRLPEEVRGDLASGALSMGQARALLALPDPSSQRQAARDVISKSLSVRDTEALVKKLAAPPQSARPESSPGTGDVHTKAAEDRLRFVLGTKVQIVRRDGRGAASGKRTDRGGRIEIAFSSESELQRLFERLTG
ncbi:MAG: ParB/RepB/Spo0J family partition protein [Acidobacteria bacterium]|nr:ParB/RepB/Spo0J family partition protein [Acidobacteriota bacterium]